MADHSRLVALCIYVCVRYRLSAEARAAAVESALQNPDQASACYEAIMRSIPMWER